MPGMGYLVFREIGLQLDLPPARMKIVHKGRLLTKGEVPILLRVHA